MRRIRISTGAASIARGLGEALIRRNLAPGAQGEARLLRGGLADALEDGIGVEIQIGPARPRRQLAAKRSTKRAAK